MSNDEPGVGGLGHSFRCAFRGIGLALKERNLRLHLIAAVLVVLAAAWLRLALWQLGLLLVAVALVLLAEMVNTALELVVDLASPGYAELARQAKDVAAGAVLFAALAALALGNIVFAPAVDVYLVQLRGVVGSLPPAAAVGSTALLALVLPGWWAGCKPRQRALLAAALVTAIPLSWGFIHWPTLPLVTVGGCLWFALWVTSNCRRLVPWMLILLSWLLLWTWLLR